MNIRGWDKRFLGLAIVVLTVTAAAKIASLFDNNGLLHTEDPVFKLEARYLLLGAAALEILAIVGIWVSRWSVIGHMIVAFLGMEFLSYRWLAAEEKGDSTCPCLGTMWQKLGGEAGTADGIMLGVAVFFLVGGMAFTATWFVAEKASQYRDKDPGKMRNSGRNGETIKKVSQSNFQ